MTPGLSPIEQRSAAAAEHTKEWMRIMSPPFPSARMKGKVDQQCCLVQTRGRGGGVEVKMLRFLLGDSGMTEKPGLLRRDLSGRRARGGPATTYMNEANRSMKLVGEREKDAEEG